MNNKLEKIFEIVSFYDDCRWSSCTDNYNMINFYSDSDGLDSDTKLLTHWLCYITNRQMPFERIFDVGGYVFSELVWKYKNKTSINELLNPTDNKSFVKKENKDKYCFVGTKVPNERILEDYPKETKDDPVKFKPRFLPSDYLSILFTLHTLEKFNNSLSSYIATAYNRFKNGEDLIQKILFSLYLLTYQNIGQHKYEDIEKWDKNSEEANKRRNRILNYLSNSESVDNEFTDEFNKFQDNTRYHLKRAWCSLRDFLKSPEFNPYFRDALRQWMPDDDIELLCDKNLWNQLELPGDVWNNNPKFQRCVFDGVRENEKLNEFNKFLRNYYESSKKLKAGTSSPEQFDITFDFVPRMCEKNNCDICPIGRLSNKGKDFEKICLDNQSKFCPVSLVGCGYKMKCKGQKECELHKLVLINS